IGPSAAAVIVTTAGPSWALAVDGVTYLGAAALLLGVHIPARERSDDAPSAITELRQGWSYFIGTTWLWVVVVAFTFINMIHAGALSTLGPVLAKQGDLGERGWGLLLSAEAVGLLLTTLVMIRVPLKRPLLFGMLGMGVEGVLITMLGLEPGLAVLLVFAVLAGVGVEIFSLGWNLAMQEHVPDEMLSRAYSYDAVGSFVAIPIGALVFGPLGAAFGVANVILIGGLGYIGLALLALCSSSVRRLERVSTTSQPVPG
ncbi:MAG: MFS transporter, partial [Actinomycetota bacterium]|nr:MFS transporter [Actinomycetota bacterium]